jgi:predicted oxidoreductase
MPAGLLSSGPVSGRRRGMDDPTGGQDHVKLGNSGLTVSPMAWGMWRFGHGSVAEADTLVRKALDAGITLLDTADIYGLDVNEAFGAAEALLGRVLAADRSLRARFVLASKGGIHPPTPYDSSASYLIAACEASLRRLGVDHIDLYQIHRPDMLAHPAEVASVLTRLRKIGKIREVGVSNYSVAQTRALQAHLDFELVSTQPEFSALRTDVLTDGTLDLAMETGMAVLAWSPLGGGRLAGAGADARTRDVIAALDRLAAREGVSRTAVAYAWLMRHPSRPIPIIGSQRPERIAEALQALRVKLSREDWYGVLQASMQEKLP